jgi:uncharacterized protein YhdP
MIDRSTPLSTRLAGVVLVGLGLVLVGVVGAYLGVRHILWPRIDEFRPQIVAQLERRLGRPVSIDALRPGWEGVHPTLDIEGLRLDGADGEARLSVAGAHARLSWRSLPTLQLRLAELRLLAPVLRVERLGPGRFAIAGFELPPAGGDPAGFDGLIAAGSIRATDASLRVDDHLGELPPLRVDALAFALETTGRRHRASLDIGRPDPLAQALSFAADIYRPPFSRPADWRRWRGELHLSGRGIELARIAPLAGAFGFALPDPLARAEGRLDALAWIDLAEGGLDGATLKLRADRPATVLPTGRLALAALEGRLQVRRGRDGGLRATVGGLSATDPAGVTLALDGEADLDFDPAHALRAARLRMQAFDLAAVLAAARDLPLPDAWREVLARVDASGRVRELGVRWHRRDVPTSELRPPDRLAEGVGTTGADGIGRFDLDAAFEELTVDPRPADDGRSLPSVARLTGSVRADQGGGRLTLATRQGVVSLPGVFDQPRLLFEHLDGDIAWRFEGGSRRLRIDVPKLAFTGEDARGSVVGHWAASEAGAGPGSIELDGRIERIDARHVARYLPRQLPAAVREWVRGAVPDGIAEGARFEVAGDLAQFPFREPGSGRFRISAAVSEATLAYAPAWPRIERIRGDLVFDGAGFEIRAQSGSVEGVRLTDVQARLPDYREGLLTVEGRGTGAAQDMVRFVNASPLAATVSTFTRDLAIRGDARLALKLALPLWQLDSTRVLGSVDLPGNDVALDSTLPPFSAVTGRVDFDEHGLSLSGLQGTLLGGPIRVDGRPSGDGRMRIEARGSIDAAGMRSLVDNPLTRRLDGRSDYRATVDVDRRASTLLIESDLVGLSSSLPAPFAKSAADAWPLRVQSRPLAPPEPSARPPGDRLEVRLGDDVAVAVERLRDPATERLVIRRAGFSVGAEPALREGGLSVLVRTREIDLDAWRAVLGDGEIEQLERSARSGVAAGMSLVPDLVSVVADDVSIAGRGLHEVVFGASRVGGRWRANIASREIEGHFDWRDARPGERIGTLTARFARLELPRSREGEVESVLSTASLPGLDLTVEELVLGRVAMGRLALTATNGGSAERPVWSLDRMVVENPAARLEAKGAWALAAGPRRGVAGGEGLAAPAAAPAASAASAASTGSTGSTDGRSTALEFRLDVLDAGRLLARMSLPGTVRGGSGSLVGQLSWRGSPIAIDYPTLDGDVALELGKGEFLKVDPGAAKLIGVLNMQSLPRRLSGDFRDLFAEGFAFDAIGGAARIEHGIARTDGLKMRSVQAQVTIRGEADLQRETQRLNVEVVPELNAGLASLALGAMVNPVIGLGSFAAQYVLRKPLQDVLAYDIDVTGSWSDPAVSERNRRMATRADPQSP